MLLGFSVANFRSFRDRATFSFVPARAASGGADVDARCIYPASSRTGNLATLKVGLVYGANASGKSNLLLALGTLREIALAPVGRLREGEQLPVEPFRLNPRTVSQPTELEVVFVDDGRRYRYGFKADRRAIKEEWLYHTITERETLLFHRRHDTFDVRAAFTRSRDLAARTRPDSLFLAVAGAYNVEAAERVLGWLDRKIDLVALEGQASVVAEHALHAYSASLLTADPADPARQALERLMVRADVGIRGLRAQEVPVVHPQGMPASLLTFLQEHGPRTAWHVTTRHALHDDEGRALEGEAEFSLMQHESAGTQRLFALAGPIVRALREGRILATDELDNRLHPSLCRAVVELFLDPETNPHGAQLLLATHEDGLLEPDLLRRDQIWFTEKDAGGGTALWSLAEVGGVRRKEPFRQAYLRGRYGGVPILRRRLQAAMELAE